MPTYDYHCDACGHRFEAWQQISERKKRKCPKCGKPRLRRLVGAGAGLIFRGTGFYVTDYKRKGSSGSGESSSSSSPSSAPPSSEKPAATSSAEPGAGGAKKPSKG
jgi:putative FmdB family regulatory protein